MIRPVSAPALYRADSWSSRDEDGDASSPAWSDGLDDEAGASLSGLGEHGVCPVCLGALMPEPAGGAPLTWHVSHHDELRCPLTTPSYQPEGMTVHHMRDPAVGSRHRSAFMSNWTRHFRVMKQLAPSLTVRRLTVLVDYADVLNLWSYPALVQRDLPHVLLVLAGFFRECGPLGEVVWVRFWFDGRVSDVGDLWTEAGVGARLFRMVYRHPEATPFPTSRELVYHGTVRRDRRFPDRFVRLIRRSDVREFERFMAFGKVPTEKTGG